MAGASYKDWLTEDGLLQIESWARDGLTNEQIANNIGVKRQTFQAWLKKYDVISDTLKKGKRPIDFEVENALLKNALGFKYTEEEIYKDDDGNTRVKKVNRYQKPDTTAQIFWLKNRKPKLWRDAYKQDVELVEKVDIKELENKYNKYLNDLGAEE